MKKNSFPLPDKLIVKEKSLSNAEIFKRLRSKICIILSDNGAPRGKIKNVENSKSLFKLKKYLSFNLETYHDILLKYNIDFSCKEYDIFIEYRNKVYLVLNHLKISKEHILNCEKLNSEKKIKKYLKENLTHQKNRVFKLINKSSNELERTLNKKRKPKLKEEGTGPPKNYYKPIKIIYTPMGNKR